MRIIARFLVLLTLVASGSPKIYADAYDAQPKLVLILVFDQFRGDYLDRYRADFETKNGWNLFLKQGVHFTDAKYSAAALASSGVKPVA